MSMPPDSFSIGSLDNNMYTKWGIKCIAHDSFRAPAREDRQSIPFRHGGVRTPASREYFDDKNLNVFCRLTRQLSKADFREIIYDLSEVIRIFFWDEPDKHYIAKLYRETDVNVFPHEIMRDFVLPFECFPFALGPQNDIPLQRGINHIDYKGTAETPTLIIIRNPNTVPLSNIRLTTISRIMAT